MKQPNYFLSIAYNLVPVFLALSLTSLTAAKSKFHNRLNKLNKQYTAIKVKDGQTPLHLAVISNDKEWTKFLLPSLLFNSIGKLLLLIV